VEGEYYLTVKIAAGNITVKKEPKKIKYKYTDTEEENKTTLYEVFTRSQCKDDKLYEFQLVQWPVGSGVNKNIDYYSIGDN